jgi:threonine dehydrogenase-like Zn-dependent dehydrogenase
METIDTIKTAVQELVLGEKKAETCTTNVPLWDDDRKMHCLVWNGKKTVDYVEHARPRITEQKDAILKVTATTICGSDLHLFKGTFPGMKKGDILGHEFMGIIEEVGSEVKKFKTGDRVIVGFSIACGECTYCKREEYTACDRTNPSKLVEQLYGHRPSAFYGYSHLTGGVPGGQAEYVRVAFADVNCCAVPESIPDEKAVLLTDVIPTAYHGTVLGEVGPGRTVAIWGLGPIGLMCARICQIKGAATVIGIDCVPERIQMARNLLQIDAINFKEEKVLERIPEIIKKNGRDSCELDVAIECAGFDYVQSWLHKAEIAVGLETDTSEIFAEMFQAVRKFGNVSVIGVYSGYCNHFPIGAMMEKDLIIKCGQCPAQKYWKEVIPLIESNKLDPSFVITHKGTLSDGPEFYRKMQEQEGGFVKCVMRPNSIFSHLESSR